MSTRDFRTEFGVKRATLLPLWDDANAATNLKYTELDGLPGIKVFSCHRLKASLTATSCASNFADAKHMACVGCPIGSAHRDAIAMQPLSMDRYDKAVKDAARWDLNKGLACVRCERTGATATTFVARFRLIKSQRLCVSCYNRQREVEIGANSKGATPVKLAHLKPATVTIGIDGNRKTLDIGLRSGWPECDRFVKQAHPGAELMEVVIGGEIIPPFSLWHPLPFSQWVPVVKKPLRFADIGCRPVDGDTRRSRSGRGLVSDISGQRFGKLTAIAPAGYSDPGGNAVWHFRCCCGTEKSFRGDYVKRGRIKSCGCVPRKKAWLPAMTPEQALAYEQSFEEDESVAADEVQAVRADSPVVLESDEDELVLDAWPTLAADWMPQFVAWLTEEWPEPQLAEQVDSAVPRPLYLKLANGSSILGTKDVIEFIAKPAERIGLAPSPVEPAAPSESAATIAPERQPATAVDPVKRSQAPRDPPRVFHPLLKRLGFEPGKLYGSVMPLAVDQYSGKKSVVLFGCLCATTFKAPAQAVLRGHTTSCGCGVKPEPAKPAHDLAAYLRTLKALPPYRPWLSTTCWHRIQVGTYAYARSAS